MLSRRTLIAPTIATLLCMGATTMAQAEEKLSVSVERLTMEAALKIAQGAVAACREKAISIGVVVVDRGGRPQVILRDTVASDLTLTVAEQKAYTAMAFQTPTGDMSERGGNTAGLGKVDGLMFAPGGLPIQAGGVVYGAVGVSGAPSGTTDEICAKAGIETVIEDLEMSGL